MPASRPAGPASPAPPHSIGCALSLPCQSGPTLRLLDCSYVRHTSNPLVSPAHKHVSRASSQLHAHSARYTVRVRCLHCGCPPPPVPPCRGRSLAPPNPKPNACRTAHDPPRQIEELEKKLETERRYAPPHPAVPRACGPGCARLRRYPQPHPTLATHPATPPPHPIPPHPTLTSALRVLRRKRQEIETQLTEIQAVVKQAAAK